MIPQQPSTTLNVLGLVAEDDVVLRASLPSLIVTIEAAIARVQIGDKRLTLDRSGCLVVPKGEVITLAATEAASRLAVFGFGPPIIAAVDREYATLGFDHIRFERQLRRVELLPRTVWIHELVHRYVFERHALGRHGNLTTGFLEIELVKEIYYLLRDRGDGAERASNVRRYSPAVARAIRYIEAHLFDACRIAALARRSGASESTLLRLFRNEVGFTPSTYWRNRKLDEALLALRGGGSVSDVATRVGYDNPTAFGFAFRRRFGRPPSAFRPQGRLRAAP